MSNVNRFERGEKAARRREKRQQEQSLTVMDDAPKKKKESEDLERDFDGEEIAAGVKKYIRADVPVLETSSKVAKKEKKKKHGMGWIQCSHRSFFLFLLSFFFFFFLFGGSV